MFHGDPKELSQRAAAARKVKISPEKRMEIATKASYARWYKAKDEQIDRIDAYLRGLSIVAAQALAEGNRREYVSTVAAMGQYERMKLMIEGSRSKDAKPADITELDDSVKESVKAFRKGRDTDVIDVTEEKK